MSLNLRSDKCPVLHFFLANKKASFSKYNFSIHHDWLLRNLLRTEHIHLQTFNFCRLWIAWLIYQLAKFIAYGRTPLVLQCWLSNEWSHFSVGKVSNHPGSTVFEKPSAPTLRIVNKWQSVVFDRGLLPQTLNSSICSSLFWSLVIVTRANMDRGYWILYLPRLENTTGYRYRIDWIESWYCCLLGWSLSIA